MTTAREPVPSPAFPLLRLGVFLLCSLALVVLTVLAPDLRWFRQFEHWTDDARTLLLSDSLDGQHPDIAVVAIDDNTLRHFGITSRSPLDREMLSQIVARVKRAGARVIGIDVFFLRATTPAKDELLMAAIKDPGVVIILGVADERAPMQTWQRDYQASFLKQAGQPAGFVNLRRETSDEVVRYHPSPAANPAHAFSFSLLLARALKPATAPLDGRRIAWLNPPSDGTKHVFRTILAHDLFAFEGGAASSNIESGSQLKGRLVLIGANFVRGGDEHRTPFNIWNNEKMPGVMVHAHMIADLLAPHRAVSEAAATPVRLLAVLLGGTGLLLGWLLSRNFVVDSMGWGFATVLLVGINAAAFYYWRTTFPFVLSVAAWAIGIAAGRSLAAVTGWLALQNKSQAPPFQQSAH